MTNHHAHTSESILSGMLTVDVLRITHQAQLGLRGTLPGSTCHAGSITVLTLFQGQ